MSNNERETFEQATAKVQHLMLWDKVASLEKKYKERKRLDIGMIVTIIGLAIKTLIFGK